MANFKHNLVTGEKILFEGELITFEGYEEIDSIYIEAILEAELLKEKQTTL
jgi:hypothetical protein